MTEKLFYRLCTGLSDVGKFYPIETSPYDVVENINQEIFKSVYYYTEAQIKKAEQKIEVTNKKTGEVYERIRGVGKITATDGTQYQTMEDCFTNQIIFDLDSKDFEAVRKDAIELTKRLIGYGIQEDAIQYFYSGNKGVHIKVDTEQRFSPKELKGICSVVMDDLSTCDTTVYNPARILRLPLSKHHSGLYTTPLTFDELNESPIEEIKDFASSTMDPKSLEGAWEKSEVSEALLALKDLVVANKIDTNRATITGLPEEFDIDFSKKPPYLTPAKYVLEMGYIPPGFGQDARMILAASYKKSGKDARQAYYALKATSEARVELYGEDTKFEKEELWDSVISTVFSDSWQGGTYGVFHPLLSEIDDRLPAYLKRKDRAKIIDNASIFDKFKSFARDIDKNTLKFDIKSVDDKLKLLTGTAVGVLGVPGCHVKDTGILMYDGSVKPVQEVELGELLMGPDSKPREVLKLINGREKLVKFTPYRSEEFTVNMNHILNLTPSKQKQKGKIPGNLNITVENYIKGIENKSSTLAGYRLHKVGVEFNKFGLEKQLVVEPYFLGLWLGDGTSENQSITTMDDVVTEYLLEYSKTFGYVLSETAKNKSKASRFTIKNPDFKIEQENVLLDNMRGYGLINKKHIPKDFLTTSRENRMKLLAGLIDSDGSLESNGKSWEITQKNKRLSEDIQFLCRSLGYHCSVNEVEKSCMYKGEKRVGVYQQMIITPVIDEVPVRIERRKLKSVVTSKNVNHYGFKYEILEEEEYYGFTLGGDHLYLTEDFIVHHNSGKSTLVMNLLANNSKKGEKGIFYSLDMGESLVALKQIQRVSTKTNDEIFKMVREEPEEFSKLAKKASKEFENVMFSFKFGITPDDIRTDIIEYEEKTGDKLRLVVVDYLENVQSGYSDPTVGSGAVAQQLADIASELDVLVVVLLQTQKTMKPGEEITTMRSIKGASVIEQCLSVAIGIYREGQHLKYTQYDSSMGINVLKNRYGSLSSTTVGWDGARSKIMELTNDQRLELRELRELKKEADEESKSNGWG